MCRLVELLSATSVLLYKAKDNFHDCLLPKSWISELVLKLRFYGDYNTIIVQVFGLVRHSGELAMHLLNNAEHGKKILSYLMERCLQIRIAF